jgi:hypothetical protein
MPQISALAGLCAAVAACSGSSTTIGPEVDGSSDATNGTDTGNGTEGGGGCPSCEAGPGGGTDAGDSGSSSSDSGADASGNDSSSASDSGGDARSDSGSDTGTWNNPCPDVGGSYTVAETADNKGCGTTLNTSAPECIVQAGCNISLTSVVPAGPAALNGTASLQNDGSFSGAAITEGTGPRTGCTGTWASGTSALTVDCGGTNSSQACVVVLTRKSAKCN